MVWPCCRVKKYTKEKGGSVLTQAQRVDLKIIFQLNGCLSTQHDFLRGVVGIISVLSHSQIYAQVEHQAELTVNPLKIAKMSESKAEVQKGYKMINSEQKIDLK